MLSFEAITIVPPLPVVIAEASTLAFSSMVTVLARITGSEFVTSAGLVPTKIRPPPTSPVAVVWLLAAKTTWSPATVICPPLLLAPFPSACNCPVLVTVPATN